MAPPPSIQDLQAHPTGIKSAEGKEHGGSPRQGFVAGTSLLTFDRNVVSWSFQPQGRLGGGSDPYDLEEDKTDLEEREPSLPEEGEELSLSGCNRMRAPLSFWLSLPS